MTDLPYSVSFTLPSPAGSRRLSIFVWAPDVSSALNWGRESVLKGFDQARDFECEMAGQPAVATIGGKRVAGFACGPRFFWFDPKPREIAISEVADLELTDE